MKEQPDTPLPSWEGAVKVIQFRANPRLYELVSDLTQRLRRQQKGQGITMSSVLRDALRKYLADLDATHADLVAEIITELDRLPHSKRTQSAGFTALNRFRAEQAATTAAAEAQA